MTTLTFSTSLSTFRRKVFRESMPFVDSSVMPSRPLQYILYGPIAPGWIVTEPLLLDVERHDDGYIVSESSLDTYGAGSNLEESVAEFGSMLIDLYQELAGSEEILSSRLRELLGRLHAILATK
jgi:hypothetical protein